MSTVTHPPAAAPKVFLRALALIVAALVGIGIGTAIDDGPATTVTVDDAVPASGGFDQDRANDADTKRLTSLYEMYRDREQGPGPAPTSGVLP